MNTMNEYQAPAELLKDKVILVTGAGDGIGAEAARCYAAHGATCILLGRTVAKLEKVYDEIVAAGNAEPAIVPLDLKGATPSHYQQMGQTIADQFGRLDGVLHNASVVFTTSSVGRKGRAFWGTYAVSKFATEGVMQTLADEYRHKSLRFNCINPGGTRTSMRAQAFPAENPETLKTPADIMPTYLYLMGDDSIEVTGQSLDCQPK